MPLLRLAGVVLLIGLGAFVLLYLMTGDRRYLRWGGRTFQIAVVLALIFFGLMALERLMLPVL